MTSDVRLRQSVTDWYYTEIASFNMTTATDKPFTETVSDRITIDGKLRQLNNSKMLSCYYALYSISN
jgi:hypothetical protein